MKLVETRTTYHNMATTKRDSIAFSIIFATVVKWCRREYNSNAQHYFRAYAMQPAYLWQLLDIRIKIKLLYVDGIRKKIFPHPPLLWFAASDFTEVNICNSISHLYTVVYRPMFVEMKNVATIVNKSILNCSLHSVISLVLSCTSHTSSCW